MYSIFKGMRPVGGDHDDNCPPGSMIVAYYCACEGSDSRPIGLMTIREDADVCDVFLSVSHDIRDCAGKNVNKLVYVKMPRGFSYDDARRHYRSDAWIIYANTLLSNQVRVGHAFECEFEGFSKYAYTLHSYLSGSAA